MALMNGDNKPGFPARRDVEVFDDGLVLQHLEGYSGNRLSGRKPKMIWVDVEHGGSRQISVNKTTHRIRFENETESQVTIVIEPKETA